MVTTNTHNKAALRRIDWRFLLPTSGGKFQHLVLLGGTRELADCILNNDIAQRVSLSLPNKSGADAIACLYNAQVDLDAVAKHLLPGGVVYLEIDRRSLPNFFLTPGKLKSRLRKSGLHQTGSYWVFPNFNRCKRYIPLDLPEALQWYLSTLYEAGTPLHHLLKAGIRLSMRLAYNNFHQLAPYFAVTAKSASEKNTLQPELMHKFLPIEIPGTHLALLTSGQDDGSRAILLPFSPGLNRPQAVIKIATTKGFNANTEYEHRRLAEVRSCVDEDMQTTIPEPLGIARYGNLAVSVESYAAGHSLSVSSGRWRASTKRRIDDLQMASNWLINFHRQTQIRHVIWDDSAITQWIDRPITKYVQLFNLTDQEKRLFDEVRKHSRSLIGKSIPLVRVHYDYGPWNLYRSGNGFTVIDWEFGRDWGCDRLGPSLYDLLYFVTHWFQLVTHAYSLGAEVQAFYKLFIEPDHCDPYVNAVQTVFSEYASAFNIDRRFIPLMLVYVWVDQSISRYSRKYILNIALENNRVKNNCIKRIGVLAEHTDLFFRNMSENWPAE